jgi:hypothetical protein
VISVSMRSVVYLFGDPSLRRRATPPVIADKVEALS